MFIEWILSLSLSPDSIIAYTAICVSLFALHHQRKHDRLSVTPLLDTTVCVDKDKKQVIYQLYNHGTGPAIVKKFCFYVDGAPVDKNFDDSIDHVINVCFPEKDYIYSYFGFDGICEGSIIVSGECTEIFSLSITDINWGSLSIKTAYKLLLRAHLRVIYSDVYGKRYFYDSKEEECRYLKPNKSINAFTKWFF